MTGEQIGHYKILEKLGSGGMGEVWLAEDTRLERRVALKFLPYHASQSEPEKARFIQEAKAAARLSHANIAQVYEIGEEKDRLFIVMEFVDGGSLSDRLEKAGGRPIPLDTVMGWIRQAAEGLAEAHSHGITHRDIKPDNLMLTKSGHVKITDFGLARLETATRLTAEGTTLGTINYMSPEQVLGREVDQRCDLFSLGATFYELLTGHQAFEGKDASATYYAILEKQVEPLTRYRRSIPEGMQALVDKMLEKDAGLRIQSAAEVVSEIGRLQRDFDTQLRPLRGRRTLLEWVRAFRTSTRVTIGMIVAVILIQLPQSVSRYRSMLKEFAFGQLKAASEGAQGPLWTFDSPKQSVIKLPYRKLVLSKERVLAALEELKTARDVDAFVAAALLKGGEEGDRELAEALRLSPTDAKLHALRARWRYDIYGARDTIALGHANQAVQLDPDNGEWAMIAAIGAASGGDTVRAENLLNQAAYAERFESNLSKHFGALYRSLNSMDLLRPNWQMLVPVVFIGRSNTFDLVRCYVFGKEYTRDYGRVEWKLGWEAPEPDEEMLRGQLIEALGHRMLADSLALAGDWARGATVAGVGIYAQMEALEANGEPTDYLEHRQQAVHILYRRIFSDPTYDTQLSRTIVLGIFTFTLYGWCWFFLVWTVFVYWLLLWRDRWGEAENRRLGRDEQPELSTIALWVAGLWIPWLFLPAEWSPFKVICGLLLMVLLIIFAFEFLFPFSIWSSDRSNGDERHEDRRRLTALIGGIVTLVLIVMFYLLRISDSFYIKTVYGPVLIPLLGLPFILRRTIRGSIKNVQADFLRRAVISLTAILLIASLLFAIESAPIGRRMRDEMHTAEPSFLMGTESWFSFYGARSGSE